MSAQAGALMQIGELAASAGVTVATIRYYESRGLVQPTARRGGRRYFDRASVARLQAVAAIQQAGFSLDEIHALVTTGAGDSQGRREAAADKLAQVRARIQSLERVARVLEQAAACGCHSVDACGLIRAESAVDAARADVP